MARGKKMGRATAARTEREEASSVDSSDEEEVKAKPKLAQRATAGQLPPSDSEDSESEEEAPKRGPCGKQPATAGTLPPNSDDDEEESDDEESDDEDDAAPRKPAAAAAAPERTPKQIAEDLAKLELVRKRRADAASKRIAEEGFDRFAPAATK